MKNILCISLLYCLISSGYAQTVTFSKKSDRLTEALGHRINSDGTTMDNKNQVSADQLTAFTGHSTNFRWMQMASFSYKSKKYYVLYYQSLDGDYEYPLTQAGWGEKETINYWIISADEYAQLKSAVTKKEGEDISLSSYIDKKSFHITSDYSEQELQGKILETLNSDLETCTHRHCMMINSLTADGKDIVRFKVPGSCVSVVTKSLKYGYFEVPAADFKKLLID